MSYYKVPIEDYRYDDLIANHGQCELSWCLDNGENVMGISGLYIGGHSPVFVRASQHSPMMGTGQDYTHALDSIRYAMDGMGTSVGGAISNLDYNLQTAIRELKESRQEYAPAEVFKEAPKEEIVNQFVDGDTLYKLTKRKVSKDERTNFKKYGANVRKGTSFSGASAREGSRSYGQTQSLVFQAG